ncbi:pentatricopeptide repeat-containing protein At5g56310-like [Euphorbia lathyris]|uniref:pentatricopeptide repeat-containing protein At5g56310-like n=1 Tax=Euphorbia lathyris TaxID=212925 RepID=UPI0033143BE2
MYWRRSAAVEQLISLLSHCSNFKHIQQAHGFMISRGLDYDNALLNRLIHVCTSLGFSNYAYSVFNCISQPDIFLYNSMIKSLSSSHADASIFLFNNIQFAGFRPDSYSYPFVLKAVVRLLAIEIGMQIHCQTIRIGLGSDVHIVIGLIQMYSSFRSSRISDARKVFDEMRHRTRDVALWNSMVAGYAKIGDMENAQVLFDCMVDNKNVISWTALISGYAQMNLPRGAIDIFRRMQVENVEPDEITMLAALSACADLGALELGEWIHNYIDKFSLHRTVPLCNALIDMYSKSGNIKRALEVFEDMKHRSVITWTTIIAGLALHGLGREALEMFSRMERAKVKPNGITFIALLSACSHVGLVEIGRSWFSKMRLRYGIEPRIQHYGCMIDLVGRAGYLEEAEKLIKHMPFEPNAAIWGSLLAAAYIHGEAMLGARALRHLITLEPNNSGNYALLSNIYASHGMWKESRIVRKMMRDKGVKKIPGGSFIELNNRVTEFTAGETLHPQFDEICAILWNINGQLRLTEHLRKECVAIELLEFGG